MTIDILTGAAIMLWLLCAILCYGWSVAYMENGHQLPTEQDTPFVKIMTRFISLAVGIILGPFGVLFLWFATDRMLHGWKV